MKEILIAGLPDRLATWLAQRLDDVLVQVTYTGDDALEDLGRGTWSLLVLDSAIEGMPAEQVIQRIRQMPRVRSLPIIMVLSADIGPMDEGSLQRLVGDLRVDQILLSPVDRGELVRHAANLLNARAIVEASPGIPQRAPEPEPEPAPRPDAPVPGREQLNAALSAVWGRARGKVLERVAAIDLAIAGIQDGTLTGGVRRTAETEAHRLAGALGTFGSQEGTRLARQLEHAFASGVALTRPDAMRLARLVDALRRELETLGASHPEPAPAAPPVARPASAGGAATDRAHLLVFDPDAKFTQALEAEGRTRGLTVRVADTLAAARDAMAAAPQALVLDLSRPEEEGGSWTLLRESAERHPGVPIVVTARRDSLLDRVRALQHGARLFLPRPVPAADVFNAVARLLPRAGAGTPRILAVDDDPAILSALRAIMEPQGFNVHTLDSPLRFWSVLKDTLPDLLILDVDMPHLNGIELCRVARGDPRWADLPILFLTARTDMDTLLRIFATGADDYVSKPIVAPALLARIRTRLTRSGARA